MKGFVFLFGLFVALAVQTVEAQSTNTQPTKFEQALETEAARLSAEVMPALQSVSSNKVEGARFTYGGILIELLRMDNPLQLINPLASSEYGAAEDRVVRDLVNKKTSGLKFFSIQF